MPYEKKRAEIFDHPFKDVYRAAFVCAKELGGKILKNEPEKKMLHVQMYKRMKGETLGDRSQFEMTFVENEPGQTTIQIYAYPLNAVGQKLMFGARKGAVERAMTIFFEEVKNRLDS